MAQKTLKEKGLYVEPSDYFSPEMMKAAEKWEKEQAKKKQTVSPVKLQKNGKKK